MRKGFIPGSQKTYQVKNINPPQKEKYDLEDEPLTSLTPNDVKLKFSNRARNSEMPLEIREKPATKNHPANLEKSWYEGSDDASLDVSGEHVIYLPKKAENGKETPTLRAVSALEMSEGNTNRAKRDLDKIKNTNKRDRILVLNGDTFVDKLEQFCTTFSYKWSFKHDIIKNGGVYSITVLGRYYSPHAKNGWFIIPKCVKSKYLETDNKIEAREKMASLVMKSFGFGAGEDSEIHPEEDSEEATEQEADAKAQMKNLMILLTKSLQHMGAASRED